MSKILRNVKILVLFLTIACLIGVMLATLSRTKAPMYGYLEQRTKEILEEADSIEGLSIGHSQNKAITFNVLGITGAHYYMSGMDLFETEYALRALVPRMPELQRVHIAMAYVSLDADNAMVKQGRIRIRNYYAMPCATSLCLDLIDWDVKNKIKSIFLPITRFDNWRKVLLSPPPRKQHFPKQATPVPSSRPSHKPSRATYHLNYLTEDLKNTRSRTVNALGRIVAYLKQKDVNLVLYVPPYKQNYITPQLKDHRNPVAFTRKTLGRLAQSKKFYFRDYNLAPELLIPEDGFQDDDHLNAKGSILFSKRLGKDLAQYYSHTGKETNEK